MSYCFLLFLVISYYFLLFLNMSYCFSLTPSLSVSVSVSVLPLAPSPISSHHSTCVCAHVCARARARVWAASAKQRTSNRGFGMRTGARGILTLPTSSSSGLSHAAPGRPEYTDNLDRGEVTEWLKVLAC